MSNSWRETASEECQSDFDALLDECIDIAAQNLVRRRRLDPIALVVGADGDKSIVMAEDSNSRCSRDEIVASLRGSVSSTKSFAIVSRVRHEANDNLIEIHLEHRDVAIQMVFPYEVRDTSTFDLGAPRAARAEHRLFTQEFR